MKLFLLIALLVVLCDVALSKPSSEDKDENHTSRENNNASNKGTDIKDTSKEVTGTKDTSKEGADTKVTSNEGTDTKASSDEEEKEITDEKNKSSEEKDESGGLQFVEEGLEVNEETMLKYKLWKNGMIPYLIDEFSYDIQLRNRLQGFFREAERLTGLTFVQLTRSPPVEDDSGKAKRWLLILNRRGYLGCVPLDPLTNYGVQKLVIGYDCMENKDLLAMLLEVVGVPPQHRAPNRDNYINVNINNVLEDKRKYFEKFKEEDWPLPGMVYDFGSVGHWPSHAYTWNGYATIEKLNATGPTIGSATGLTYNDLSKLKYLYKSLIENKDAYLNTAACRILYSKGKDFDKDSDPEDKNVSGVQDNTSNDDNNSPENSKESTLDPPPGSDNNDKNTEHSDKSGGEDNLTDDRDSGSDNGQSLNDQGDKPND